MSDDNFPRLAGEALEAQIARIVEALREGKSVIANCIIRSDVCIDGAPDGDRFTIRAREHGFALLPTRPRIRNLAAPEGPIDWPDAEQPLAAQEADRHG